MSSLDLGIILSLENGILQIDGIDEDATRVDIYRNESFYTSINLIDESSDDSTEITDLTNYAWIADSAVDVSSVMNNTFNLEYIVHDTREDNIAKTQTVLKVGTTTSKLGTTRYIAGTNTTSVIGDAENVIAIGLGSGSNVTTFYAKDREFHILGGGDVTNSTLIAFLKDNGTLKKIHTPLLNVSVDGDYGAYKVRTYNTHTSEYSQFSNEVAYHAPEQKVNLSNRTFFIKSDAIFTNEHSIHSNFTSGGQSFSQVSILQYDDDWEIWYVNGQNAVLAYAVGQWELENRYLTFADNTSITSSEYSLLTNLFDEYVDTIVTRKLYINGKLAVINGKRKGVFNGLFWDNVGTPPTPPDGVLITSDNKYFVTKDGEYFAVMQESPYDYTIDGSALIIHKAPYTQLDNFLYVDAEPPKLSTPTNLSIDGDYVVFDEVDNAQIYEVYANSILIGESQGESLVTDAEPDSPPQETDQGYTLTYDIDDISGYQSVYASIQLSDGTTSTIRGVGSIDNVQTIVEVGSGSGGYEEGPFVNGSIATFPYTLTQDSDLYARAWCLTGDTLITMSDGTQKFINELSVGDKVLSVNPKTLQLEEDEITYSDSTANKTHNWYDVWTFDDGTIIKTVHRHRLYNCESESFVNMDEWMINEHTRTISGKELALVSHERIKELTNHYTIFTKKWNNYFANGCLTGNKYSEELTFEN